MLRALVFIIPALASLGLFLFVDFTMAKRWANTEDGQGLTVSEYISGFTGRVTGFASSASAASGLPSELAAMMPQAPEGWTVRPALPEDTDPFMAKEETSTTREAGKYIGAVARDRGKFEQVALTFEKGERRVVFQVIRYPNLIFTSFMAMQQRFELQMLGAKYQPSPFMTVRGLDVTEDILPKGMRGRYFLANVGAQIQIRVVASSRMSDADLVPFFQTLHVKAMNASVVDKVAGLGDVPVIVLASELDKATREAFEADRAARAEAAAAEREARRQADEAEARAAAEAEEKTDGILQPTGRLEMKGTSLGADCADRAGGKSCSAPLPPAEGE